MLIRLANKEDLSMVFHTLERKFLDSRFTCTIEAIGEKKLKLRKIRLKENKPYCGNHPAMCEVQSWRKPRNLNFLEGADWVGVNDLINDTLDSLNVSAHVASSVCVIRKGRERRLSYSQSSRNLQQWEKEQGEYFSDYCLSIAPRSEFPLGTPGNSSYIVES